MSGHIRRRGERSWELKFDIGTNPLTGKRETRYHSFKGTKRDAEIELTKLMAAADEGTYVEPSKINVRQHLEQWLLDHASKISPKTLERYSEIVGKHLIPALGALPLRKLAPVNIQGYLTQALASGRRDGDGGLAARTVKHHYRVLSEALRHAVSLRLLSSNPCSAVQAPKPEETEIEILTEQQARDVLAKLKGRALYPLVALGLATGMRRGELLALRWRCVDFDAGKVRVEASLEQTKGGGLRFKAPKTRHGRRTISIPAWIVTELRAVWKAQQEQRLALGQGKGTGEELVFGNWDGSPRSPNATSKEFTRTAGKLGLPAVTLHCLRHTHASQLIAAKMDVLTISRRLGHGSPTITLGVYGHLFANTDDQAASIMEAAFAGAATE